MSRSEWVKIGQQVINLERVCWARYGVGQKPTGPVPHLALSFRARGLSGATEVLTLHGEEAEALWGWLSHQATDVLSVHAAIQAMGGGEVSR